MSDKDDKQFDPTPQRLQKAKEDGNLFRAQDIVSVVMLAVGVGVLAIGMPAGFGALRSLAARQFVAAASTPVTVASAPVIAAEVGMRVLGIMLPFLGALVFTALAMNVLQSGWNVTMKPLEPKPDRISPLKGFKRIFSAKGAFNALKSMLKIAIVGPIAYYHVAGKASEIGMLHALQLTELLGVTMNWILVLIAKLIVVLGLLSGLDFAFEKWKHKEDLKMSKQEIKDESKQNEGDPAIKGKRRQLAAKMSRRVRIDHAVLQADVVVTNPTHFAVALRYDPEVSPAPLVLVKGMNKRALKIKRLAYENEIPVIENKPLARALYRSVEETEEIPAELYPAVAALLAEIYRKKGRKAA